MYDTPRSFSAHPEMSASGSDHSRSHSSPESGTSVGRMMRLICSGELRSGERPAWMQKIFSSRTAAKGSTLNTSWNFFQILML